MCASGWEKLKGLRQYDDATENSLPDFTPETNDVFYDHLIINDGSLNDLRKAVEEIALAVMVWLERWRCHYVERNGIGHQT